MRENKEDWKNLSDKELADRTLDQNKEYFEELVNRYYPKLFRYLHRLLNHDEHGVEECLSETFLKAYLNLSTYSPRAPFSAWLYRIAHNQAVDHLRRGAHRATIEMKEEHLTVDPLPLYEDKDYIEHILGQLSIEDRNLLTLYYLEELTLYEISDILKIKPNTIAVRIKRIRERLRKDNPSS